VINLITPRTLFRSKAALMKVDWITHSRDRPIFINFPRWCAATSWICSNRK